MHELIHIKKGDTWKKTLILLVTTLYWWIKPLRKLHDRIEFVLEVDVDKEVKKRVSDAEFLSYAQCLIDVYRLLIAKNQSRTTNVYFGFVGSDQSISLSTRLEYMGIDALTRPNIKRKNRALGVVITVLFLISYCASFFVVFQPQYPIPNDTGLPLYTIEDDFDYLRRTDNGMYEIVLIDGTVFATVEELDDSLINLEVR